jgi:hypothetical protein
VSAAADGDLTVDQAREELERLAKENACLMDVSDDGLVVFRFPEFERPETEQPSSRQHEPDRALRCIDIAPGPVDKV